MRAKLIRLQFLLLCLLGLYPLLKFNLSSLILISFTVLSVIIGVLYDGFNFKKQNIYRFIALVAYLFILFISVSYSQNIDKAINRSIQFLPLLIAPFFVAFYEFQFSKSIKKKGVMVFVIANICFSIIITLIFLLTLIKQV